MSGCSWFQTPQDTMLARVARCSLSLGGMVHRMLEDVARRAALGSVPRIHGVSVQQVSLEGAVLH